MLDFNKSRGSSGLSKTRFQVHENTIVVSRFCAKLYITEIAHDGTIGDVTKKCNNLSAIDDELFKSFCITNNRKDDLELE